MTKRDELLDEAYDIIRGTDEFLLDDGELKLIEVSENLEGETIATIRGVSGFPPLFPHPESATILVGKKVWFDLLVKGPRIIRELYDLVQNGENTPKSTEKTPESGE